MIILASTTDKIQLTTGAAVTCDVHASVVDHTTATDNVVATNQNTAISTATTTDIVAAPASGNVRNVKTINVRNKHASSSVDVTVIFDANGTDYELYKVTLNSQETLEYVEGVGWFVAPAAAKIDVKLLVASDVINATTSFADVTGLTYPVSSAKNYGFQANLIHTNDASTTGSRFGINGPTMTSVIVSTIDTVTTSVTASAHSSGTVTALDTAATAQTTGSTSARLGILTGWFLPSASGTFAIRCASEVAVAAGLTVKAGSFCRLWEF